MSSPRLTCYLGSSLSHLWSALQSSNRASTFTWSVIDRWHDHPLFIKAVARRVQLGLEQFEKSDLSKVLLLFSAHSIPQKTASRGDQYPWEIAHTVQLVMRELQNSGVSLPFLLCWQSKVGYLPWLEPSTAAVIERTFHHPRLCLNFCVGMISYLNRTFLPLRTLTLLVYMWINIWHCRTRRNRPQACTCRSHCVYF